jgi:hypothetical protein
MACPALSRSVRYPGLGTTLRCPSLSSPRGGPRGPLFSLVVRAAAANVNLRFQGCAGPVPSLCRPCAALCGTLVREPPVPGLGSTRLWSGKHPSLVWEPLDTDTGENTPTLQEQRSPSKMRLIRTPRFWLNGRKKRYSSDSKLAA